MEKVSRSSKGSLRMTRGQRLRWLWLVGLGGLAVAQRRTSVVCANAFSRVHETCSRTTTMFDEVARDAQAQATGLFVPITLRFEHGTVRLSTVSRSLACGAFARTGIATRSEFEALARRIEALQRDAQRLRGPRGRREAPSSIV